MVIIYYVFIRIYELVMRILYYGVGVKMKKYINELYLKECKDWKYSFFQGGVLGK